MSDWLKKASARNPQPRYVLPETAADAASKMLRRVSPNHDAARHALLQEDFHEAENIAFSDWQHLWSYYVLFVAAFLQGQSMRAWMMLLRAKTHLSFTPDDHHYRPMLDGAEAVLKPWMAKLTATTPDPSLSVCLITRDSERSIRRCLESVASLADEIVLVDTGSTDRTVEIAEEFGAKVGHFGWIGDFAAARNAALEMATGAWVLSIDSDEWLDSKTPAIVKLAIRDDSCMYCPLVNNIGQNKRFCNPRLFKRDGASWSGKLHENIKFDGEAPMAVYIQELVFNHDGYDPTIIDPDQKRARNRAVIDRIRADEPSQAAILDVIEVVLEHRVSEEQKAALVEQLKDVAINHCDRKYVSSSQVFKLLSNFLVQSNQIEEAVRFADLAEEKGLQGIWSYHVKARVAWTQGRREEAKEFARLGMGFHDYEGDIAQMRRELEFILRS